MTEGVPPRLAGRGELAARRVADPVFTPLSARRPATRLAAALLLAALSFGAAAAYAQPAWIAPGDPWLRSDLLLLSDEGVINTPVTTWPVSWRSVAADIASFGATTRLPASARAALVRMRERAARATETGRWQGEGEIRLASDPPPVRSFADEVRGRQELWAGAAWRSDRFVLRLRGGVVGDDPLDGRAFRLDGSYAGVRLGNWLVSAGEMSRWWGPGNAGSLILSNNARPVPAIAIDRDSTQAFHSRWLRWLGPWSANVFWGRLEADRAVPHAQLLGARVTFRPLRGLEIGLVRTAQWCGEGRPCGAGTFWNLLRGRDNMVGPGNTAANQPGNQLAGIDLRWSSPVGAPPFAVYAQFIGEDEASGLPSKDMALVGIELWNRALLPGLDYRAYLEAADTTCAFKSSTPIYDCAYEHFLYRSGYRYRGRVLGYPTDNDSRSVTGGLIVKEDRDRDWNLRLRYAKLNRGGAPVNRNSVSVEPAKYTGVEFSHRRATALGTLELSAAATRMQPLSGGAVERDFRAAIGLTRHW